MSQIILNPALTPSAPGAGKRSYFLDTADGKLKSADSNGFIHAVDLDGWRDRPTLYNGAMEYWQRQVPATVTTYSSLGGRVYTADRWFVSNENASVTAARIDTEAAKEAGYGVRFYGQIAKSTNTGKFCFGQAMAATSIMDLRSSQARVQFNLKASSALTVRLGLVQLAAAGTVDTVPINAGTFITAWGANGTDPTLGTNLAYIAPSAGSADGGSISGSAMSCVLSTAWKRFSAVFAVPNDCHNLALLVWTDAQAAAATSVSFGEAGLYEGPEIRTNFVAYSSLLEMLRCQKYYAKSFPLALAPAASQTVANAGYGADGIQGKTGSGTANGTIIPVTWPVRMRAAPTVTFFTPVGSGAVAYRHTGTTPAVQGATASVTSGATELGTVVTVTNEASTNGAVGDLVSVHWTAEAEV